MAPHRIDITKSSWILDTVNEFDGLVNESANALEELHLYCTNPWRCKIKIRQTKWLSLRNLKLMCLIVDSYMIYWR